jgi:hypothetical protein
VVTNMANESTPTDNTSTLYYIVSQNVLSHVVGQRPIIPRGWSKVNASLIACVLHTQEWEAKPKDHLKTDR